MGRRLLVFGLCLAIQTVAVSAPLVHAHLDDHHDDHHASGRIHAHFESHGHGGDHARPLSGPAIHEEEDGERVISVPLFVAAHNDVSIEFAIAQAPFTVTPDVASVMRRPPQEVRSHGPPPSPASSPRAPPAFSVLI